LTSTSDKRHQQCGRAYQFRYWKSAHPQVNTFISDQEKAASPTPPTNAIYNLVFRKVVHPAYLRHLFCTESNPRCRAGILTYNRYNSGRLCTTYKPTNGPLTSHAWLLIGILEAVCRIQAPELYPFISHCWNESKAQTDIAWSHSRQVYRPRVPL
jgi:hypothetical protein